jgi:hypothetical protein
MGGASSYFKGIANVSAAAILGGLAVYAFYLAVGANKADAKETLDMLRAHGVTTQHISEGLDELRANETKANDEMLMVQRATCVAIANAQHDREAGNACMGLVPPRVK